MPGGMQTFTSDPLSLVAQPGREGGPGEEGFAGCGKDEREAEQVEGRAGGGRQRREKARLC